MSDIDNENEEIIENEDTEQTVETDAEKLTRLTAENAELVQKNAEAHNERSQMGRRVRELQDYQKTNDATIQNLQQSMDRMNQPKEEEDGYIDMTNPNIARNTIKNEIYDFMTNQNNAQLQYETKYEKHANDLMNENESLTPEERQAIMTMLKTQKDNMFNDPLRDAQYNINIAKGKYYEDVAKGSGVVNKHIKGEKPVGTGVGGAGTKVQSTKKTSLTPAEQKLKDQFAAGKTERGW